MVYNLTDFGNEEKMAVEGMIKLLKTIPFETNYRKSRSTVAAMKRGIIFLTPNGEIETKMSQLFIDEAIKAYGIDEVELNLTMFGGFERAGSVPLEQLYFEQIVHYWSTYGREALGLSAKGVVSSAEIKLPQNSSMPKQFTIIREVENIAPAVDNYLRKTHAPAAWAVELITPLLVYSTITNLKEVPSKELSLLFCIRNEVVPKDPMEIVRLLSYLVTRQTLLIKSESAIYNLKFAIRGLRDDKIKTQITHILENYGSLLAEVFYRYKPILLCFKKVSQRAASAINHIRRMAVVLHKPLSKDKGVQNFIHCVREYGYYSSQVQNIIGNANNRELVKLINAMNCRVFTDKSEPAVYSIRNGKVFVKHSAYNGNAYQGNFLPIIENLTNELISRIKKNIEGKVFYIPKYINYAAPISEKQFVGNMPYGTSVSCPVDQPFVTAIHWVEPEGHRTDLDYHMISQGRHFGWNAAYRDGSKENKTMIYSGDLTEAPAPGGATEAFWINPTKLIDEEVFVASVHKYSGPAKQDFKFFLAEEEEFDKMSYTAAPSNVLFEPIVINMNGVVSQMVGIFTKYSFYFYGGSLSSSIVPNKQMPHFIKGIKNTLRTKLSIEDIILLANGEVIHDDAEKDYLKEQFNEEFNEEAIIDLSPNNLTQTTLFDIVDGTIE